MKSTGDHIVNDFFVRTVETEFRVNCLLEAELITELPIDENMFNRFPFDHPMNDDLERSKIEVYKIGSEEECQHYIDEINERIRYLFKVEEFSEWDYSNPLINFE